jgi:hypothetical protein
MQLELFPVESGWVCNLCGRSTFHTDYEYLVNRQTHLQCALEKEVNEG